MCIGREILQFIPHRQTSWAFLRSKKYRGSRTFRARVPDPATSTSCWQTREKLPHLLKTIQSGESPSVQSHAERYCHYRAAICDPQAEMSQRCKFTTIHASFSRARTNTFSPATTFTTSRFHSPPPTSPFSLFPFAFATSLNLLLDHWPLLPHMHHMPHNFPIQTESH